LEREDNEYSGSCANCAAVIIRDVLLEIMNKANVLAMVLLAIFLFTFFGAPTTAPDAQQAARLNNIGVAYMNQQLFEKALKNFDEAAAKDPNLKLTTLNRGVALLNLQRPAEAKALLEKATKNEPNDPYAWFNLGLYYKNSSEPEKAIDAFRRVIEIDPGDADTWYFLGSTCAQLKQLPQAIAAFDHALKLDPLHASATFGLARAYQQSGQADQAREHLKKFQYITQHKLGAPISLAYGEQGKYSRAEESPLAPQKVPPQIPVKFVDVTKEAGIVMQPLSGNHADPDGLGPGACFFDFDNDSKLDIFLSDNGTQGGISLYNNLGAGRFEDVTKPSGLDPSVHGFACTAGDYDNDGFTDLAVTVRSRKIAGAGGVLLLHNEKNGTFKDVTKAAGITAKDENAGLSFIDYDHDGDLDLYVTRAWEMQGDVGLDHSAMWRNNANGTFTDVTAATGFDKGFHVSNAVGTDYNNDRAVDLVTVGEVSSIFENPREGAFKRLDHWAAPDTLVGRTTGVAALDYDHDGWMDLAITHSGGTALTLWRNNLAKTFEQIKLPNTAWVRAYGVVTFDYDNDGWVDLAAVGETKDGRGEVRLFRNLGPDGWKDVTADVSLDKIQLKEPRAIIAGDYDNDGAVDLLITQNHGPTMLLRNEGGNKNNWLRLALKGLNDNKSAIGTKVEVFSDGIRQKYEVYGSSGYLGQNSPYLTIGLGQAKEADIVRMLWPMGVLQDEIQIAANKVQNIQELDRRGSSCPTLFAWNGHEYKFIADMLGAGVVGHWIGPNERNIPRPTEYVKLDRDLREKNGKLSFRFMEPLEESVYLDSVGLLAVDHLGDLDVYPNEYFASNPPYPPFKVVFSKNNEARPPAGAWDEHGHNVLPDLLMHRYFGDFKVLSFAGFTEPHTLTLDLGEPYRGGPLWLLMHGEIEYFSATSMYAADQAHLQPFAPYVEALVPSGNDGEGKWLRVIDDLGFPAGGARTMTADLSGKLPIGTRRIRLTTNLQIYWDNILISRTPQKQQVRLTNVPLTRADLRFHGFPLKIEGKPPGNVQYVYEKASATGPYTRPAGAYTRHGDVLSLLKEIDDRFAVFGSGDEVALDFDPAKLPPLPPGWVRDYFFVANGYEKDMDFYAYQGDRVEPLPFHDMGTYPYREKSFPEDPEHINYLLEYNNRFTSGNESRGYSFQYPGQR
jgi:tetratricopeptide (TPR) repeat protein